jgi:hypothetical protein
VAEPGYQRRTKSAMARSTAWAGAQWRPASTAKRVLLVVVALILFPFLLLWALLALVHDGVQALDRGSRLGQPVVWAIAAVLVLALTLLAGGSRASRPSASAGASASASAPPAESTPTAQPTVTALPTVAAKPLPTPPLASLMDPTGDFVDENGKPAKGPAFQDIIGVYVKTNSDGSLNLAIETAGEAPSTWDPVSEEIAYGFFLDTTGDHTPDYQVLLQNSFNDRWTPSLSELTTGQTLSGDRFPGAAAVLGTLASIRLDLSTIGDPGHVAVSAHTQYTTYPDPVNDPTNYAQRDDTAPDNAWPDGAGWIEFEVSLGT